MPEPFSHFLLYEESPVQFFGNKPEAHKQKWSKQHNFDYLDLLLSTEEDFLTLSALTLCTVYVYV